MSSFKRDVRAAPALPEALASSCGFVRDFHAAFEVIDADTPELINEAFALRYQVYCVENPFEDPREHRDGLEHDVYDACAVHGLVRHRASGQYVGTVRLILPDPANPEALFPAEMHGGDQLHRKLSRCARGPARRHVAEISRFAVRKEFRHWHGPEAGDSGAGMAGKADRPHHGSVQTPILPYITVGLFLSLFRMSYRYGTRRWIAVMDPLLLRLLRRFGIRFTPVGPLIDYHGLRQPTFAEATFIDRSMAAARPDVWAISTESGRYSPTHEPPRTRTRTMDKLVGVETRS